MVSIKPKTLTRQTWLPFGLSLKLCVTQMTCRIMSILMYRLASGVGTPIHPTASRCPDMAHQMNKSVARTVVALHTWNSALSVPSQPRRCSPNTPSNQDHRDRQNLREGLQTHFGCTGWRSGLSFAKGHITFNYHLVRSEHQNMADSLINPCKIGRAHV